VSKKSKLLIWELVCVFWICAAGSALHFAFELSDYWTPMALFAPTLVTAKAGEIIAVTITPARAPKPVIVASAWKIPLGRWSDDAIPSRVGDDP